MDTIPGGTRKSDVFDKTSDSPQTYLLKQFLNLKYKIKIKFSIVIISFLLTAIFTYLTYHTAKLASMSDFEKASIPISAEIQAKLRSYTDILVATKALFAASVSVESNEFNQFYKTLGLYHFFPEIMNFAYTEVIKAPKKNRLINEVRKDSSMRPKSYSKLKIYPSAERDEYWPVKFIEPSDRYEELLGFDTLSDGAITSLFKRAINNTDLVASGPVKLKTDMLLLRRDKKKQVQDSLIFAMPVYRNNTNTTTAQEKLDSISGFLSLGVRIEEMIQTLPFNGIAVEIIADGADLEKPEVIRRLPLEKEVYAEYSDFTSDFKISVGDRFWTLKYYAAPGSAFSKQVWRKPLLVFAAGFLFSTTVACLLFSSYLSRKHLIEVVKEKTTGLEEVNFLMTEILDSVPVPLFLKKGSDLSIQFWNKAVEDLTGINRNEILGLTGYEIFTKEEFEGYLEADRKALSSGKLMTIEEAITSKSGEQIPLLTKKVPIGLKSGAQTYLLGISEDMRSRRKYENESLLSQKLQAVGSLASGIAHEINTPMQCVSFNLHYLKDAVHNPKEDINSQPSVSQYENTSSGNPKVEQAIVQSLEEVNRVIQIVSALREFSHPGDGIKRPVNLNKLIEDSVLICGNVWKNIASVSLNLDPNLDNVLCHSNEIGQVCINMISNAVDAIEDKGLGESGRIEITTISKTDEVEIIFSDNGTGIPNEIINKIYDPFFTTKDVGRGTGQGLAITRSIIVDRHSGTVSCESKPGQGTKFVINIPTRVKEIKEYEMRIS